MQAETPSAAQRRVCGGVKKDGTPCQARALVEGRCIGHAPGAQEARRTGGHSTSKAARASRLLPVRLRPIVQLLEGALQEVHEGKLAPQAAQALASLARAIVTTFQAGEIEERLRMLEERTADRRAA